MWPTFLCIRPTVNSVHKAVKKKNWKQTFYSHEKLFGFSVHFKLHIEIYAGVDNNLWNFHHKY